MIVILKYFYEKTDTNYDEYNKLWDENIFKGAYNRDAVYEK